MHLPLAALCLLPLAVAAPVEPPAGVQIVRAAAINDKIEHAPPAPGGRGGVFAEDTGYRVHAVSYTHLTLPTILRV